MQLQDVYSKKAKHHRVRISKGGRLHMKKLISVLMTAVLVFAMGLAVTGCGGNEETKYCDEDFLKDMAKGLEARWDLSENENSGMAEEEKNEKCVQLELDEIGVYKDEKFKDTKLQEHAISYINALNKQKEALEYYDADYVKYDEMWEEAYLDRCGLIVDINKEYGIPVGSKYEDTMKDMAKTGKKANERSAIEESIEKQLESNEATREGDDIVIVLENTSETTIRDAEFKIKYYDADGVNTESDVSYIEDWEPGDKTKLTFWAFDVSYDSYEITLGYIEY